MQTAASQPTLSDGEAEARLREVREVKASSSSPKVQKRKPRRSLSLDQPAPLKDRVYTALSRFRYGMAQWLYCLLFLNIVSYINFLYPQKGWNFRSSVEIYSGVPIWLLGRCYHAEHKHHGKHTLI